MRQVKALGVALGICLVLFAIVVAGCYGPQPAPLTAAAHEGLRDVRITAVTDGSGDSTDTAEMGISGRLYALEWVDGDCANGVDITVTLTSRSSGVSHQIFQADNVNDDAIYYPRAALHDTSAVSVTYDGSNEIYDLVVVNGIPQLIVAAGGATKTCECLLYYYP